MVAQLYLFSVQKKLYRLEIFKNLCNCLHRVDSEKRLKKEVNGITIQYLPILFVYAPHYVLQFHFAAFLEGVDKTHHFNTNEWYPFILENADAHENWLLAGMRNYNLHCNDTLDLENMNKFLRSLAILKGKQSTGCPAFQSLKELDYVSLMSIIKRYSDMTSPILHLLPEEKVRRNLIIRIITVSPSNLSTIYLNEFVKSMNLSIYD